MTTMKRRLVFCLMICVTCCGAFAQESEPVTPPSAWKMRMFPPSKREREIRAALNQACNAEFIETPLSEVADYLAETYKFTVVLDARALDGIGVGSDSRFTFQGKGTSLKSSLKRLFSDAELAWYIEHDSLVITTPELAADKNGITFLYQVDDLVLPPEPSRIDRPDFVSLIDVIVGKASPGSWTRVGGEGAIHSGMFGGRYLLLIWQTEEVHQEIQHLLATLRTAPVVQRQGQSARLIVYRLSPQRADQAEAICRVIKKTIAPASWGKQGNAAHHGAEMILIRQSPAVQSEIYDLLEAMGVLSEEN